MFENTAVPVENPVLRRLLMAVLAAAVVWVSPAYAEETPAEKSTAASSPDPKKDKADYEFGGQILTLTEPPPEVGPSDNPRFQANPDGTITDLKLNLIWIKVDSYQAEKKWMNWDQGHAYIKKLNQQKFAGADQWRLPTRKELSSLYDETKSVPWNYYWTKNEVHIDPVFGNSHCCYWTSESYNNKMAWGFNFIRGQAYPSLKGGHTKSLTVIRAVRDADEKAASNQ